MCGYGLAFYGLNISFSIKERLLTAMLYRLSLHTLIKYKLVPSHSFSS